MDVMDAADLAAILDEIRANANGCIVDSDEDCADARVSCLSHNALRAVAAIEAVLKLADDWDTEAARLLATAARADTQTPGTKNRAWAHRDLAEALREATTRELTGKGDGDALA